MLSLLNLVSAATRPNIVLVICDDLGFNDVGWHGSEIATPVLDGLVAGGVELSRYYGHMICTPSRAALLSGKYAFGVGMQHSFWSAGQTGGLPLNVATLGDHLTEAGYAMHYVGKWHLGFENMSYHPLHRGFESFYGYLGGGEDYLTHEEGGFLDFHDGMRSAFEAKGKYSTVLFANRSIDLIAAHARAAGAKPFGLVLAFQAVHDPLQAPADWIAKYDWIADTKRRTMAAMTGCVDFEIGRVVDALKSNALYANSVIAVVADNGGPTYVANSNWPMRGGKWTLWEGGTHLAALIHGGPAVGLPAGKNFTGLMHHADWVPTLVSAAGGAQQGAPPPGLMDGISIWSALVDPNATNVGPRQLVVLNVDPTNQADPPNDAGGWSGYAGVVTGEWKLLLGWGGVPDSWCWPNQNSTLAAAAQPPPRSVSLGGEGALYEVRAASSTRAAMLRVDFPPPSEGAATCDAPPGAKTGNGRCCGGHELGRHAAAADAAACCAACYSDPRCAGFTFHTDTNQCWLKTSVAACTACATGISGAVPGRTPTPTPTPPTPTPSYPGALTCQYSGAVPPLAMRSKPMLFNLRHDPSERVDVAASSPAVVAAMMAKLQPYIDAAGEFFCTVTFRANSSHNLTRSP